MGAMAAVMASLIGDAPVSRTILTVESLINLVDVVIFISYTTHICLLVATLTSVAGVVCGHEAYDLVRRQTGGGAPGKALALAAPVAVLGVAVTGAAVGAVLETYLFKYFLCLMFACIGTQLSLFALLCFWLSTSYRLLAVPLVYMLYMVLSLFFYFLTGVALFADLAIMLPLIALAFFFALSDEVREFQIRKIPVKVPAITMTTLLIARSLVRDEHHPVPLLELSEATSLALALLENGFVLMLSVQMFQASCGAVLYSWCVTDGAGKVYTGAVAATFGMLALLMKSSNVLGTCASLGALLAASGGAGVALNTAGDLAQRSGGHAGRVGAVIGAAVGAFLPFFLTQEVKFGIMLALCAAAIPGTPTVMDNLPVFFTRP
ncbi:hypothetical protein NFI96_022193 [Prochilodus magdalenae]|nr:hypothetical protein NFI96_022193 [Prochilodus magdalenae]